MARCQGSWNPFAALLAPPAGTTGASSGKSVMRPAAVTKAADSPSQDRPGFGLGSVWIAKGHEMTLFCMLRLTALSKVKSG